MHITRLRLAGFKSFVEPTDLLIERGLTGVVGPNGCGKSNLLEALRWAMGEASHKSMRAAAMDDVIFAGTTTRPARNHASVTLFIDNSARRAPAEFNGSDSLEIMRHIERDAGSAYRINGREARAKDVKILFEDAATGARSPALVRQGQIAELVNAKPEQRRRILEDAAGTAGLSSRRHDAELRLRAAETNLERVGDVLGALTSQINGLKRQARQAKRYKDISIEIAQLEAIALYLAWYAAHNDVASEEAALTEALSLLALATGGEAKAAAAEMAATERLPALRDAEVSCAATVQRLRQEHDGLERDEARARERQRELEARLAQLNADAKREQALRAEADMAQAELAAEHLRLAAEGGTAAQELAAVTITVAAAREAETAALAGLAERSTELAGQRATRDRLNHQLTEETRRAARAEAQAAEATRLLSSIADTPSGGELYKLAAQSDAALAAVEAQELAIQAAETAAKQARATEDKARLITSECRLSAAKLGAERDTLARLFAPAKDARWAPLLDSLKVARGYEAALSAALGDDLDAPADARAPAHWLAIDTPPDDAPLPDGAEPLAAKVKGAGAGVLQRRLRQTGVVSKADGVRLRALLAPGQRLVSRDGDLWRWDGFVATAEAPSAGAHRLVQRNRLDDVDAALAEAGSAADEAADELSSAAAAREAADTTERNAREHLRRLRQTHATLAEQVTRAETAGREREGKRLLLCESQRQANAYIADYQAQIAALTDELARLPPLDGLLEAHTSQTAMAQRLRTETGRAELALLALTAAQHQRELRLGAITADSQNWQARAEAAATQATVLAKRQAECHLQSEDLAGLPAKLAETRNRLIGGIATAESARNAAADGLAAAETVFRDATKVLRGIQAELSAAREAKARVETRLDAARTRRSAEAQRIRDALDCAPEHCLAATGANQEVPLPPSDDVARRLHRLREDRERLGGVNLTAEEELTGLETQFTTLEAETADLEAAIAQLRQGIGKLTREGRKRLNDAFVEVNVHFQRLFTTLFNGGEARLEMIEDPEDPLAGGLEIIAKPPGKKPATLSLLSGGEQTLTALSLIFAVFLTNPSPICVLDEVDAPLDDSNVDRFCTLMDEMARTTETRFLVITHHPVTMSRMDRLFGVTMSEKGVSQLVSVDLATAGQYREAG